MVVLGGVPGEETVGGWDVLEWRGLTATRAGGDRDRGETSRQKGLVN